MVPTPTSTLTLFIGILSFITIMLLPAIIELKKPKDPGPKTIEDFPKLYDLDVKVDLKIEEATLRKVSSVLAFLPNLEP